MRKYYGVAGTRGYGVYTNWNQAKSARRHTPQYKVKGEKDFDKAKVYAKDKFDELQNGRKDRFYIEDITSVNVFYTKRDVSYEEYREKMFVKPFTINLNHNWKNEDILEELPIAGNSSVLKKFKKFY